MFDTEKSSRKASDGRYSPESLAPAYYRESSENMDGLGRRMLESFKRDPNIVMTPRGTLGADGKVFDVESAAQNTANSPLARKLKGRHLQMIAIGGSIGMLDPFGGVFFKRCMRILIILIRHWSLRRFWQCSGSWWPGISTDSFLSHWCYVILYCPRFG